MRATLITMTLFVAAFVLGVWIPARGPIRTVTAGGSDILTVLFGEARAAISLSLFDRAEVYFHGGVGDTDCDDGLGASARAAGTGQTATGHDQHQPSTATVTTAPESALAADHHADAGAAAGHETHPGEELPSLAALHGDLWSYLNARIHPKGHRHLAGFTDERELLPWLWAAARLDPHNVLAYEVGAYWLARRLKQTDQALRFIAEGSANNPDSSELEFCRGEILLSANKDYAGALQAFLEARRKWQPGTTAEERDDNAFLLVRTLMYMAQMNEQLGHPARARECYDEVLRIMPDHPVAKEKREALTPGAP